MPRYLKTGRPPSNKRLQLTPNSSYQSVRGTVLAAGAVPQRWWSALLSVAEPHIRWAAGCYRDIHALGWKIQDSGAPSVMKLIDMRSAMVRVSWSLAGLVLVLCVTAFGYRAWRQHESEIALAIESPGGIQEARFVEIGGIEQWIQIRGEDRRNPVVLILAGGPGNSLVPLTPVFRSWEKHFTIVQWDQRGAGKTYGRNGTDQGPMTIDRMVRDGIELTLDLLEHLHREQLIVVGHSWGTVLGVLMVKTRPDLYAAYVGTGQVVAKAEKEEILYAELMKTVRAAHDTAAIRALEAIGAPPYDTQEDLLVQREISERYDIEAERNLESDLTPVVLLAPDYSPLDILDFLRGSKFAADALYQEMLGYDARTLGPSFDVPFFIFNGDQDRITPAHLARAYFETVEAPTKGFVLLDGGGHSAVLTMSDVFLRELVARVRPLAAPMPTGSPSH
jgi:pimeloyl-ACP methyl ester carboxylesterase